MSKIRYVKSLSLFPVIEEILEQDGKVRLAVTGMSMYPFLREYKDSVELDKQNIQSIHKLDILLVKMNEGEYILHRFIRRKSSKIYLCGDGQWIGEGPFDSNHIVAKVNGVWRKEKYISCKSWSWRVLSYLWYICLPLRKPILKGYQRYGRVLLHRLRGES